VARTCCCGPPGVGKTHVAVALRREAILAGHSVQFVAATTVVAQLAQGHSEGRLEERLAQFAEPKLLIIDELGISPLNRMPRIWSSNRESSLRERRDSAHQQPVSVGSVFSNPVVATAILGCLLHHSRVITIRGDSYRLKEKRCSGLLQKPAALEAKSEKKSCSRPLARYSAVKGALRERLASVLQTTRGHFLMSLRGQSGLRLTVVGVNVTVW
jgi:hypothetical protein